MSKKESSAISKNLLDYKNSIALSWSRLHLTADIISNVIIFNKITIELKSTSEQICAVTL